MPGRPTQPAILGHKNQRDKDAQNPHEKSRFAGGLGICASKCEKRWTQTEMIQIGLELSSTVLLS